MRRTLKIPLQKRDLYLEGHAGCHKLYFKDRITAHVRKSAAPNALTIHKRHWHRASTTTAATWRKGGDGVFCTVKAGGNYPEYLIIVTSVAMETPRAIGSWVGVEKHARFTCNLLQEFRKVNDGFLLFILLFHFSFIINFFGCWRWWGCADNDV